MIATRHASSAMLPLSFILAGVVALLIGALWLALEPAIITAYHYSVPAVAATHLLVLGFLLTVVMGALYQLAPVTFETKLHSERLAWWHLAIHIPAVAGMVVSFLRWNMAGVGHWASLLTLGIILFIHNIRRTARNGAKRDDAGFAIKMALVWLSLTIIAGLVLAANRHWLFLSLSPLALMHAHAHLGVIGIFVTLIVGVSYKLVPMFALTEVQNAARARWSLRMLALGVPALFVSMVFDIRIAQCAGALVIAAGLLLYGLEMRAMLTARKRRELDWGLRQFVTALLLILPTAGCGLVLAVLDNTMDTGRVETVYALLGILGVVAFAILGMLHKIVPFLVWLRAYGGLIGRRQIPAITEMTSPQVQRWSYWSYLAALAILCAAALSASTLVARTGAVTLLASVTFFAGHMVFVMRHLFQPEKRLPPVGASPTGSLV